MLRGAGFLLLLVIAGMVLARSGRQRVDLFAALWWGLAAASIAGVLLARTGRFSLAALAIAVAGAAFVASPIAWWRSRAGRDMAPVPVAVRRSRGLACAAALVAGVWVWPPFETFMAAADSTMYVDAGIHLARTGSYDVPTTVPPELSTDLAQALFVSIGIFDQGPYLRLPGGLLMHGRDSASATPAFFPLLSTWAGVLAALGGPSFALAVAPLGLVLAVWALTLFAGECLGLAAAATTALVFLANFAVWWFGRFPMSELLTVAFVWGGLVFLGRGAPFAAGLMLGIGGVARAETLLFTVAALAWWSAWTTVRTRDLAALATGLVAAGSLAAAGLFGSPNHHVAYLLNDLAFATSRVVFRVVPALWDGRILCALALVPALPLLTGVTAAWSRLAIGRTVVRATLALLLVLATFLYLRLGGRAESLRHVGWLAGSLSLPGLVLALGGIVIVWSRGGPAARFAVVLVVLVAAIFVPSPRVAGYQPWAMRRYLPVVLPGLALGVGASLGLMMDSSRRRLRVVAAVLLIGVLVLQVRPTMALRGVSYFTNSLASLRTLADRLPTDALVVLDGGFADLQIQVPLWLVFGRETVVVSSGGPAWRALLPTLVDTGRPVYWIQNRYGAPPVASGFTFTTVASDDAFTIDLPDSPADAPPTFVMRKVVPLAVYGVAVGAGYLAR